MPFIIQASLTSYKWDLGAISYDTGTQVKNRCREQVRQLVQWSLREMMSGHDCRGSDGTREKQTHVIHVRRSHQQGTVKRPEQNSQVLLRKVGICPSIYRSNLCLPVKAVIMTQIISYIPGKRQNPIRALQ